MTFKRTILTPAFLLGAAMLAMTGCKSFNFGGAESKPAPARPVGPQTDPLPVQQARAYPENVTGMFVSLADFEDSGTGKNGVDQVSHFSFSPAGGESRLRFVSNITRTGSGAMEVTLAAGVELSFEVPNFRNFSRYTLLSMSLYSESYRDDLCVTLVSPKGTWTSHRTLVKPGWNNVLIDIQRLKTLKDFDSHLVRTIRMGFADAAGPVVFHVDDIMLVDNRRPIEPAPRGVILEKEGLDYSITLPGRKEPVRLCQGADGLWRLGALQAAIQLSAPNQPFKDDREHLEVMGNRCVGQVEVLENNPIRLRLAVTWYFPTRAGEWASLAIRQIRWEYSMYSDGRLVTHVDLNNAGGQEIGWIRIHPSEEAAWAGVGLLPEIVVSDFSGTAGRWNFMSYPLEKDRDTVMLDYSDFGRVEATLASEGVFAPGDAARDGFDESEGVYFLAAKGGQCRFTVHPPPKGLMNPVFRVVGPWEGPASASSEGKAIRSSCMLEDGSILFMLPGKITRPTSVEVFGKSAGQ